MCRKEYVRQEVSAAYAAFSDRLVKEGLDDDLCRLIVRVPRDLLGFWLSWGEHMMRSGSPLPPIPSLNNKEMKEGILLQFILALHVAGLDDRLAWKIAHASPMQIAKWMRFARLTWDRFRKTELLHVPNDCA